MAELIRFSFALSSRTLSFLQVRDALACLEGARVHHEPYLWLHAAADLRTSLIGDLGRKAAVPEIQALLENTRTYLLKLAKDLPQYAKEIQQTCDKLDRHILSLQPGLTEALNLLEQDSLLSTYYNTQKKQDWLGHKPCLPQSLQALWMNSEERTTPLHQALEPLTLSIRSLDTILHDFVSWEPRTAHGGSDQIPQNREHCFGLIVVGLDAETVAKGLIPDISGNRLAIRVRFQSWPAGAQAMDMNQDQPYSVMLVPIS